MLGLSTYSRPSLRPAEDIVRHLTNFRRRMRRTVFCAGRETGCAHWPVIAPRVSGQVLRWNWWEVSEMARQVKSSWGKHPERRHKMMRRRPPARGDWLHVDLLGDEAGVAETEKEATDYFGPLF